MRSALNIDSIQFQTSKGRFSQRYGGTGGSAKSFSNSMVDGARPLIGFSGSLGPFHKYNAYTVCTDLQVTILSLEP
jgi:hypothetical protein